MIIKKNGTLSRVLKEVLKRSKTGNASTLLNSFQFEKGKGITLFFSEAIDTILIKDESVDFNANITNDFIVVALASELEKTMFQFLLIVLLTLFLMNILLKMLISIIILKKKEVHLYLLVKNSFKILKKILSLPLEIILNFQKQQMLFV